MLTFIDEGLFISVDCLLFLFLFVIMWMGLCNNDMIVVLYLWLLLTRT